MTDEVALAEVCEIVMGQAPKGDTYNLEGLGLPLVAGAGDFGDLHPRPKKFTTAANVRQSQRGDLILGIRATIGRKVLSDGVYCLGRGVAGLRAKPGLDDRYLWHWIGHASPELARKGRGATFLQVNKGDISELRIALPSIGEQRRIAAILDAADALRTKRRQAISKLGTLTQAIFVKIFGDPARIESDGSRLTDLADLQIGFPFKSSTFTGDESGVRICRGANVLPQRIDWKDTQRVPYEIAEAQRRYTLMNGDVVVAMDRPWISSGFKIAAIGQSDEGALLVQRVARLRARSGVPSSFVYELLRLPSFTRHCAPTETTIPHISPTDFRSFTFPTPSTTQLARWSRHESTFDVLRSDVADAQSRLDTLFASLQQRAFRGEL